VLVRCLSLFLVVCFFAGVARTQNFEHSEQTFVPFPTRFRIQDRSPDVVISEDLPRGRGAFHNIITGDFNGDQIDDLLITNSLGNGSVQGAGRASVILGKSSLGSSSSINLATDQPDLAILGPKQFSQLGFSAAAGDLNGDGIDDIILSAIGTPAIYVIFGSRVFTNRIIDLSRAQADVTVLGKLTDNFSGLAIGDIDGDGFNDLIFGRQANGLASVSLLLGPFRSTTTFNLASAEADIVIRGNLSLDDFGRAIAVGDVNADGISDLVIGNSRVGRDQGIDAGAVYVFKGSPALVRGLSPSVAQPLLTILGAFGGSDFGLGDGLGRVLAIGDVNADGIDDILMGVPASTRVGNGPGPTSAGETYIVFGSPALGGLVDIRKGQQDVTIQGRAATEEGNHTEFGDSLGQSIAVGDIDGDGVADIILGAPGAGGTKDSGEAYVVLGSSELTSGTLIKVSEDDHDLAVLAQQPGGLLGSLVASADLNNDGVSDLILEASDADSPGGNQQFSGVIYIYFGGKIRPPAITVAKYKESKSLLKVFGSEFTGDIQIEINGAVIKREVTVSTADGLLKVRGTKPELNLTSTTNQVVLVRKGTRSNSAKVKGVGN
jgi:FG-GAP repeat protein